MQTVDALAIVAGLPEDAEDAVCAAAVDLVLSDDAEPGIRRVRRGKGFSFHLPDDTLLQGAARRRCLELAVPPAWEDVWICVEEQGHLQATGRDDAGRKQYLYHDAWRALREAMKFAALPAFGAALPGLRRRVDQDLRRPQLDRERVLALVLALLDETLLRIGNENHADEDGGHGLTTITGDHVDVGSRVARFRFLGKSGVEQEVALRDRRLAHQLRRMEEADQPQLLAWTEDGTSWRDVRAEDVNAHLRAITGAAVTAKDFRTWGGSVTALATLRGLPPTDDERAVASQRIEAVDAAAAVLGNTRAVARASYVHPGVLALAGRGDIGAAYDDEDGVVDELTADERALLRLLAG